ncbi:ribonuclease E [Catenulispora sp. EB89]|uniref:Rne/Rng family ribonuclease n=1 Tax=Catenulispora sp. EB89 TaxID=3156257 RepID=UPI0035170A41
MLDNEPTGVPGEQPDQTSDAQDAAATAATNEGEAPQRQRRRAASRPAGPPVPPAEGSEAAASDDAEPESKPKRARKTAAKKVPAPEPAAEAAEAGDAPAAKKTTRTRARKKAAEAEPTEASQPQDAGADAGAEPAAEASGATAKSAPTRTRRRATSAGTAGEQTTTAETGEASEAASGPVAPAEQADTATAGTTATTAPRTRTRRRATSAGTAAEQASAEASAAAQGTTAAPQNAGPKNTEPEAVGAGAGDQTAAETASRPGLTSPFANPFAAPQLPATGAKAAKKTAPAQETPAEQPAKADSAPAAKAASAANAATKSDTKSDTAAQSEPEQDSDAKPKRTRRRAASAPAGPPRAQEAAEAQQDEPDEQPAEQDRPAKQDRQDGRTRQDRQDGRTRQGRQSRQDRQDRQDKDRGQQPQPAAAQDAAAAAAAATAAAAEPVDLDSLSPAERARAIIAARAAAPAAGVLFQAPDLATVAAQQAAAKAAKAESTDAEAEEEPEAEAEEEPAPTRRTRTRNRNRNRAEQAEPATAESAEAEAEDEGDEDDDEGTGSSSRRRRRRRRRAGGESVESSPDDPPNTVVKVRESRVRSRDRKGGGLVADDDVQGVRGSTRLEAKKQRRREGRDTGRRRAPLITEAEFLARRESVERVMVVRQSGDRTQIGVLEDGVLVEHYVNRAQSASYVGNVYLGKVQNVLPSMEAAFVDIGKGRNAVLYAGEVNFDAAGITGQAKRIESVLKSGQAVLTQVTKDPIGHKGARLTSQISLPGRYLVYVPEGTMTGISRKLPENERNRLKAILKAVVPENAGVIVRTAAEGATEDELRRDVERLSAQWEEIQRKAASSASSAPTLLYGEPDLTVRVVRDIFNEDFSKLIVSGDQAWDTIREYVGGVAPDLAPRLERWTSEQDVFAVHRVDEQLAKGLDRKVWLPSGGSLVIDRTEAMVVIDVNTGKFTGSGGNLEETVTRNNIEAAEEIVRQLRLRDLGGIIVIDFIDMVLESNRDLVMRRLLECLGRDRTKHQVAEVTSLGLIQMTRKRVGQGLLEAFSETCDKCNGRGVLVHMEPVPVGHGHSPEDAERDGRGPQGRGGRQGEQARSEGQNGAEDEHEGGRGRRKRRKSHGHADRQQHFDPQYDVDGVPEEFQDFADGEHADAGPVTVTKVTRVAAVDGDHDDAHDDVDQDDEAQDEAAELSEHSDVEHIPSHAHVVAPVVTPGDVVAAEEADVTERLAAGDAQAHTVYVPHAGGDVSVAEADREETEAEAAEPVAVAVSAASAAGVTEGAEATESAEDAPKRRGLRVRRAAKRPAGPPAAHS